MVAVRPVLINVVIETTVKVLSGIRIVEHFSGLPVHVGHDAVVFAFKHDIHDQGQNDTRDAETGSEDERPIQILFTLQQAFLNHIQVRFKLNAYFACEG